MIDELALKTFIDELWAKKDYTAFGEAETIIMKDDLLDRLEAQIEVALTDGLPEEKVSELMKRMDESDLSDDEIASFLRENGVDIEETAAKTKRQFEELFLLKKPVRSAVTEGR